MDLECPRLAGRIDEEDAVRICIQNPSTYHDDFLELCIRLNVHETVDGITESEGITDRKPESHQAVAVPCQRDRLTNRGATRHDGAIGRVWVLCDRARSTA